MDFSKNPLTGAQQDPDRIVSRLSQYQTEALKEVEKIATVGQYTLDLQAGDMLFLNNHAVLHSREAFKNSESDKRHLTRLWLKNEALAWPLPPPLSKMNDWIFFKMGGPERYPVMPTPVNTGVGMGLHQAGGPGDGDASPEGSH
jgi:hypothetical protein